MYKVIFVKQKFKGKINREAKLRFDNYIAKEINKKVAYLSGEKLGRKAVSVFDECLKYILVQLNNDSWSFLWQPAIDEHEQNKDKDSAENLIIGAYRDSLNGYLKIKPEEAYKYIVHMLTEEYQTIHRLAIYAISRKFYLFRNFVDEVIKKEYLDSNYRHEMWHLLSINYQQFSEGQKQKVLELILNITETDDKGKINEGATAYSKAEWLAAIENHGNEEKRLYKENAGIAKAVPDHPDFSSYMSVGSVGHESPIPIEELQVLSIEELIKVLKAYKGPDNFFKPGIKGLTKTFKQIVKATPLKFYNKLTQFSKLDLAFIYEIIEAYRELWAEKVQLPWDDIWPYLHDFCLEVIKQGRFWDSENKKQRKHFVANRYWIVSEIGRLLEDGTRADDHAFSKDYNQKSEDIITLLLKNEKGNKYKIDSNAVSISINSPRGRCLIALINLTLRSCRISNKNNNKDHSEVRAHFQPIYDAELNRADIQKPEYEFATLVTNYLPNFIYMSKKWLMGNLGKIFNQGRYLKWLCAMQGYAYVNTIYQEVYQYLKDNKDFIKALDDKNIEDRVKDKVIQNIAMAYIKGFENYSDKNSLIRVLMSRKKSQEFNNLIWFIWTLRRKADEKLIKKVYELWPEMLKVIDVATIEGKKIASQLCLWSIFVDHVDKENLKLLVEIVPHADVSYKSYTLLENIARISQTQPFDAHIIWMEMLKGSWQIHPEQAIRQILTNLVKQGPEGLRKAKDAVSEYLKRGNDLPNKWLRELSKDLKGV